MVELSCLLNKTLIEIEVNKKRDLATESKLTALRKSPRKIQTESSSQIEGHLF